MCYSTYSGYGGLSVDFCIGIAIYMDTKCMDVVYLDLQKAFDRVPHARLISKVRSYGVNGINYYNGYWRCSIQQKTVSVFEGLLFTLGGGVAIPQGSV